MKFNKNTKVIELTPKDFGPGKKIKYPGLKNKKGMLACLASWCPHCVRFAPTYEKTAFMVGDSFPMFYLDCEKYSEFAGKTLGVSGYPTVLYIDREGKPYKTYSGERTEYAMIDDICKESRVCSKR